MKRLRTVLVAAMLVGLILGATACGGRYVTYTDTVNGFLVDYPSDWVTTSPTPSVMQPLTLLFAIEPPVGCGESYPHFYLDKEELQFPETSETYWEELRTRLPSVHLGFRELVEDRLTVSDLPAIKATYSYISPDGPQIKQMMVIIGHDSTIWNLTFISTPSCWSHYEAVLNKIVESFKVINGSL